MSRNRVPIAFAAIAAIHAAGTGASADSAGLTKIVRAGECRKFSTAIRRMIFCDTMEELRAGDPNAAAYRDNVRPTRLTASTSPATPYRSILRDGTGRFFPRAGRISRNFIF